MPGIRMALIAAALTGWAQPADASERCGCQSAFEDLVAAVERSYAGFGVTVNGESRAAYRAHTARVRAEAQAALAGHCFELLQRWADYFADGHLQVTAGPRATVSQAPFDRVQMRPLLRERIRRTGTSDPIEGLWQGPYGMIGVFRAPQDAEYDFFAVGLDSAEADDGIVVATFEADRERRSYRSNWRGRDGGPLRLEVSTADGAALYAGFWGFRRADADEAASDPLAPSFRLLDEDTALLHLPSMLPQYRDPLQALLRANADILARIPRLILDLRGNMGGSDSTYEPLLPYIATGPIASVAGGILNSEDHVRYYERFVDRDNPENTMPWVTELLDKMSASPRGSLITIEETSVEIPGLHAFPRQVAIVVDGSNGSSAETFLLKAMQSAKVTVLGRRTRGNVDYLNPNLIEIGCPADDLRVSVPAIRRSLALPADAINGSGIAPDVRIPDGVSDWVLFAARYLIRP